MQCWIDECCAFILKCSPKKCSIERFIRIFILFYVPGPWRRLRDVSVPADLRHSRLDFPLHRLRVSIPFPRRTVAGELLLTASCYHRDSIEKRLASLETNTRGRDIFCGRR